jgi:hypothetical protein
MNTHDAHSDGDVILVMTRQEASHLVDAVAAALTGKAWSEDVRQMLTGMALFVRDSAGLDNHVPAAATGAAARNTRAAA